MAILMSIHKKWSDLIFDLEKDEEIRKSVPKNMIAQSKPERVYFYETKVFGGIGMVVGEALITEIHPITSYTFKHFNRFRSFFNSLSRHSKISTSDLLKYSKGRSLYAWHISKPRRYDNPVYVDSLKNENGYIKKAPQSWCYIEDKIVL